MFFATEKLFLTEFFIIWEDSKEMVKSRIDRANPYPYLAATERLN